MTYTRPLSDRFWDKVEKTNYCWLWTGGKTQKGYGLLGTWLTTGGNTLAHRVSYGLHFGKIPTGLFVLHMCDNPSCVRPTHLFLGTHQENMNDAKKKGRSTFGQKNPQAKLSNVEARRIKLALKKNIDVGVLASQYLVSRATINAIARGDRWGWL